jgi:hypothetical protein
MKDFSVWCLFSEISTKKKMNSICSVISFEVTDLYPAYMIIGHARQEAHT